ncbi:MULTISPECIES: DUF1992 domain-containing protein [Rhodococcus]|jgi:hypothetical protein|uniref:DUF1992 domain-containing protein n=1 Tax=Rhodococcus aetherivorans TaxID=191292 RepID=N1MBF9_9NOCA|nr:MULTISPECIES: DUF1992 domain-containing protein [Rhodococcus]AKE92022.1 molecular chaperone DnaJ [Rhodococcus aetherivorans]ANZ27717.1 molecular chaperone DnaJ [Rhodococcus sp. WB1]MBC2589983.1 DUF1992 domain-containing protein [Rhodococcus aetherivorans]MDV6293015.1 DUF1992 domain-containing protein [Rhodococcus aetherivorans]OLL19604.1 molecular chaperone DnaJ [Rhodococcus sp. M8]
MTERKRPDITFESWIERQIRVAQERGDFDNLRGAGKPIPHRSDDELWWVKDYLRREGLSTEALLPPPLQLRKEIERLRSTVLDVPSEPAVRQIVRELNRRIVDCLRAPSGPLVPIHRVDPEEVVRQWAADRAELRSKRAERAAAAAAVLREYAPEPPRRRWWHRVLGIRSAGT